MQSLLLDGLHNYIGQLTVVVSVCWVSANFYWGKQEAYQALASLWFKEKVPIKYVRRLYFIANKETCGGNLRRAGKIPLFYFRRIKLDKICLEYARGAVNWAIPKTFSVFVPTTSIYAVNWAIPKTFSIFVPTTSMHAVNWAIPKTFSVFVPTTSIYAVN